VGSFITLFNGKDLADWHGQETADPRKFTALSGNEKAKQLARDAEDLKEHRRVENSEIVNDGQGVYLTTDKELTDFAARLEFGLRPGGDNGLAIRYPGEGDTAYVGMCELQILDDLTTKYGKLDPRQYHGSAYGMVPAKVGYQRPVGL